MAGPDGGAGLRWGVEPMCAVLSEHGVSISPSTYYEWIAKPPTRRQIRDAECRDHHCGKGRRRRSNVQTLGSRKMWIWLRSQGHDVARCTVERMMREHGWEGARYGSKHKTTVADDTHMRYPDLVDRRFYAAAPNRSWVADSPMYRPGWVRLRGIRHRCLQSPDPRVAGRPIDDHRPGPRRRRACLLHPRPGRHHQPAGADRPQRRGQPIHLGGVHPRLIDEGVDPSVGSVGDAWTTRWPRPPSDRSRTNSSAGKDPGATSTRSSSRPPMGDVVQHRTPARIPRRLHPRSRREALLRSQTTPPKAG